MSVINKMLRDLDKRGAAQDRVEGSIRGAGIPLPPASGGRRWKIAAGLLSVSLVLAAAWIVLRPGSESSDEQTRPAQSTPLAQVTPRPAETQQQAPEAEPAPAPQQQAPAPSPPPQAPAIAVVAPPPPVAKPEPPVVVVVPPPPPASKAPAREVKQERKPAKTAPKPRVPVAEAKPSMGAPAADAGRAAAPAQEAAKGSISVERQNRDSRAERASAEYRSAVALMNQGRIEPAIDAYAGALRLDPRHAAARQALVALLMGRGRMAEAQGVLREGLAALPENAAWAMLLARLQVEGGDGAGALATLDDALPHAKNRPDYHAFTGTLLQMQNRHKEAIAHYEIAVRLSPDSGRWLTGLAISLEEEKRLPEAREAYQRALTTGTLGQDLQGFVQRKLGQLK